MEPSLGTLKELLNFNLTNSNSMADKNDVLKKIYFDRSGFGSIRTTYADAKAKDNTITMSDVKTFFEDYVEKKKQQKGFNSFIAPHAKYEYQVDYSLLMMYLIKNIK